jgi:hypothetical protein
MWKKYPIPHSPYMPDRREFTVTGSSLIVRGCSCGITVNVHALIDNTKDSFWEKPECVYGEKMFLNDQSGMKAHVKWSYGSKFCYIKKKI